MQPFFSKKFKKFKLFALCFDFTVFLGGKTIAFNGRIGILICEWVLRMQPGGL